MKIAVQVPIKARSSTRVPNKNFRELSGKPLYRWLLDELLAIKGVELDVFVDSEGENVFDLIRQSYPDQPRLQFHKRLPWFAEDQANGNHLLSQFGMAHPEYDVYAQAFVTAVTLRRGLIEESLSAFASSRDQHDSMFLVHEEPGWIWYQGKPVNYDHTRPDGLPRSQDAMYLKETTGLYAITRDALFRTACRIGTRPLLYKVQKFYTVDIDTMDDFHAAEAVLRQEADVRKPV